MVLVVDPGRPEQERDLETFYRNFAEPNNLYTRQCLVAAVQVQREGSGLGGWQGERRGRGRRTRARRPARARHTAMRSDACALPIANRRRGSMRNRAKQALACMHAAHACIGCSVPCGAGMRGTQHRWLLSCVCKGCWHSGGMHAQQGCSSTFLGLHTVMQPQRPALRMRLWAAMGCRGGRCMQPQQQRMRLPLQRALHAYMA